MAEVVLKLTGDNSSAEQALNETAQTMAGVNTVAKKTNEEIKKGFDEVAKSAKKANDEMSNPKPSENQKKVLSVTQQIKNEIKALEAAAVAAGEGTTAWAEAIAKAGQKKADLKDLKEAIAALDPDAVAKSFLGLASSVAGGFTIAQSAIALTGNKSEELEKTLLKVQAAQGLLAGLQQLANTQDELAKARIIILNKLNTLEVKKGIVAVQGATIAQRIWNLAMSSNPIGLLIAGLSALTAIIITYISYSDSAKKAEEARATAIDGSIIKNKELRDTYNETVLALREVQNEYDVLSGKITEYEATLDNIREKNNLAVQEIQNETKAKLAEAGGYWNNLRTTITSALTGVAEEEINAVYNVEITKEAQEKLEAQRLKFIAETAKAEATQAKKTNDEKLKKQKEANDNFLKAEKDFLDALKNLRDKARQAEIDGLTGSERIEAERKLNQDSIDEFEKSIIAKGQLVDKDFQLSKEQQEQFAIIRNQINKDANDKLLKLNRDFEEKKRAEEENANQEAIEFATKALEDQQKALEESNKAKVLLTKEGSEERLNAEIEAIIKERDFILENTKLTNDQRIIVEQEALKKIADLQKEFADQHQFSLAKLLGISDKQLEELKKGLSRAGAEIGKFIDAQFEAQNKLLDQELKLNEDRIADREDNIKSLQDQLKEELDLQRQGLANNVDAVKAALEAEQQAKQQDLERDRAIKEEKRKLALAQLAIDSAAQASDLITASAEIFKVLSAFGPLGIVAAGGTIGLMIASFIKAKAEALKAVNSGGFYEGGYTGDMGTTEVAGAVHGQEFVSTAKTTKKHRKLLEALHSDNYNQLTQKDLAPLLSGTGVVFSNDAMKELRSDQEIYTSRKANEPLVLLSSMDKTNKAIKDFFNYYKNKPEERILPDGTKETRIGNTLRRIRKK